MADVAAAMMYVEDAPSPAAEAVDAVRAARHPQLDAAMVPLLDNPWNVADEDFPWKGTNADRLTFLLHYAVLAPSGHNTQPWLFKIAGDELELYADRSRALPVVDPDDRELVMSCGAALFHLRIAMRHFGFEPYVRTFPDLDDPDLMAFVRLGPRKETDPDVERMFGAIRRRRTNRGSFEPRDVPHPVQEELSRAAEREGARLVWITEADRKQGLAEFIAAGDRVQGGDKRFRRELAAWVHPNRTGSRDGLPGYALGVADMQSYAGPLVVRTFDWGRGQAAKDRQLAEGSPALMVVVTDTDTPPAWLAAGQALDRVLLLACDHGLCASFLNQPVEVPELRPEVASYLGETGQPQVILRVGYGDHVRKTPRRPLGEVMSTQRYL